MANRRWGKNEALLSAPPIAIWPDVHLAALDETTKEIFLTRKAAIQMYVSGLPGCDIESATGIDRSRLSKLLKQCIAMAEDGKIFGFRGLLPFIRFNGYSRKAEEKKKLPQAKGGKAGMLQKTLKRFPDLDDRLITLALKKKKKGEVHEYRISPKDLHKDFIDQLEELGVQKTEWPFNTQSLGKRSIGGYMRDLLDRHFARAVHAREEQVARAHVATGTGRSPLISFQNRPYSAVEIDAHRIDALFTVAFDTPEGTRQHILLNRIWLLAAVCRESSAVINYTVVYSEEVTADDVLKLIRQSVSKTWTPKELNIAGLKYPPDGGLPSGVIPEYDGALWGATLLDGHLSHLSNNVKEVCRKSLGFSVNWGPAGHFERRPNVERLFKNITDDLFKRLPSTTGSKPDSGRAPDAEQAAIRYKIVVEDMEQLLDIKVAQYNATNNAGLSYMSPLEYLRYYVESCRDHFRVRHLPENRRALKDAIPIKVICTVRGGRNSGRRPYIKLDGAIYNNPVLADSGHLVGQKLLIEIDEEEYRHVHAYLPNGAELGILSAQGRWSQTKHSRQTRKRINRLIHRRELTISQHDCPVRAYMRALSTRKEKAGGKKPKHPIPPKDATRAVKISKESGIPLILENPVRTPSQVPPPILTPSAMGRPLPDLKSLLNRKK